MFQTKRVTNCSQLISVLDRDEIELDEQSLKTREKLPNVTGSVIMNFNGILAIEVEQINFMNEKLFLK